MEPKPLFAKVLQQASGTVRMVQQDMLNNPTPCSEWKLKDLLNHMVNELLWAPEIIKGKTTEQVGDRYDKELLGSDPQYAWKHAADAALVAVHSMEGDSIAHLSYGDIKVGAYVQELAADLYIHAWDVGQSLNFTILFDPQVAETLYELSLPKFEQMTKSELFGAPKIVQSSDLQAKLLALFGRHAYQPE